MKRFVLDIHRDSIGENFNFMEEASKFIGDKCLVILPKNYDDSRRDDYERLGWLLNDLEDDMSEKAFDALTKNLEDEKVPPSDIANRFIKLTKTYDTDAVRIANSKYWYKECDKEGLLRLNVYGLKSIHLNILKDDKNYICDDFIADSKNYKLIPVAFFKDITLFTVARLYNTGSMSIDIDHQSLYNDENLLTYFNYDPYAKFNGRKVNVFSVDYNVVSGKVSMSFVDFE